MLRLLLLLFSPKMVFLTCSKTHKTAIFLVKTFDFANFVVLLQTPRDFIGSTSYLVSLNYRNCRAFAFSSKAVAVAPQRILIIRYGILICCHPHMHYPVWTKFFICDQALTLNTFHLPYLTMVKAPPSGNSWSWVTLTS